MYRLPDIQQPNNSSKIQKQNIIQLQRAESGIKKAIDWVDDVLLDPNVVVNKSEMLQALQNEHSKFDQYQSALQKINIYDRVLYQQTHKKIKQKIIRHKIESQLQIESEEIQSQWAFRWKMGSGLLGAFCLHLIVGSLFRWGIINPYITSFYKLTTNHDLQTGKDAIGSPLAMLSIGLTIQLGGKIAKKIGTFSTLLVSVICCSVFIFIASKMPYFFLFVFFHNVAFCLSAGMLFSSPIYQLIQYVPSVKLVLNTFIMVGEGLGSTAFGLINSQCMNPQNYYPQKTEYYINDLQYIARKMPNCISQTSYWMLGIGALGILLLLPVIKYNSKRRQGQLHKRRFLLDFNHSCHSHNQAIKSRIFWVIGLIIILSSAGNFYIFTNFKALVKYTIRDQVFLHWVFFSGSLGNGAFRIIWGLTFKNAGFHITYFLAILINLTVFTLMPFYLANYEAYFILLTLCCIVLGGLMTIFSNLCILVFGVHLGEQIFSYYWIFFTIGNFTSYFVGNFLTPLVGFGQPTFLIFMLMVFLASVITLLTKFQGPWQNQMSLLTFENPFNHSN